VVHLEKLYHEYHDRAAFAFIYIEEAPHIIPGYEYLLEKLPKVPLVQQQVLRRERICRAANKLRLSVPVFLDSPEERARKVYSAWPARLIVVGSDGRIAHDFGSLLGNGWEVARWPWAEITRCVKAETSGATSSHEPSE
jgi:hypothetical protein